MQFALLAAVAAGPAWFGGGAPGTLWRGVAAALVAAGVTLALVAGRRLGRNLTPLPVPVDAGRLVTDGVYAYVRHPIYGGVLLAAFGWAAWHASWGTLVMAAMLWGLFEVKSRFEERALIARYPDYAAYRTTTRRFVPYLR